MTKNGLLKKEYLGKNIVTLCGYGLIFLTLAIGAFLFYRGIGTFTTLLLGYKTAERLYELERIEGREEAVERLDDVLFHKIPYISDYI